MTRHRKVKKAESPSQPNGTPQPNGNGSVVVSSPSSKQPRPKTTPSPAVSTSSKTTSVLSIWAPTLVLIFGGCCSNVYTLESLIKTSPSSGPLITAFQFLLVGLATFPRHFSPSRGWRHAWLRPRAIPLRKWLIYTAYFLSINILNNMAFKYRISIPLHIILRSAGPVTTMAVGRMYGGKRYPTHKVVAVFLLFVGVVLAAFSDAASKEAHHSSDFEPSQSAATAASRQAPGFALLASALILSACMGLFTDNMYSAHGRSSSITSETLFYSHAMSLPYFASQVKPLMHEFAIVKAAAISDYEYAEHSTSTFSFSWFQKQNATGAAAGGGPVGFGSSLPSLLLSSSPSNWLLGLSLALHVPRPVLLLLLNAATQLLCIVGVNRLSAQSSSLTVSIVLNIRKLASLILSIWLFGNDLPSGVMVGAAIVFLGGGLYAMPTGSGSGSKASSSPRQKKGHETTKKNV
ncbi:golgi uridine diphosphate-N-acetylglucosamine transporter [Rhinocladiella similis]